MNIIKRFFSTFVLICLVSAVFFGVFNDTNVIAAEDETGAAFDKWNGLFDRVPENAYVITSTAYETNLCTVLPPKDDSDLRNTTTTTVDGIDSLHYIASHYMDIVLDESFYEVGDKNFIVSVVFHDNEGGPGGKFFVRYNNKDGVEQWAQIDKPGNVGTWSAQTIVINDIALSKPLDGEVHFRIATRGGKNTFKKVEIINQDKLLREGKDPRVSCLNVDAVTPLERYKILDSGKHNYTMQTVRNTATEYDLEFMLQSIKGNKDIKISESLKEQKISQRRLLEAFLDLLGYKPQEDIIKQCSELGMISGVSLVTNPDADATVYNLINIAKSAVNVVDATGTTPTLKLMDMGFYDVNEAATLALLDKEFYSMYFTRPVKLPYKVIQDPETGRQYYFVDFFGNELRRNYQTHQQWSQNGDGFVVGVNAAGTLYMHFYNIEEQMLYYIDTCTSFGEGLNAIVGEDNYVYYTKNVNGRYTINKASLDGKEHELLYTARDGVTIVDFSIDASCRYAAFTIQEVWTPDKPYPNGAGLLARVDLETGEWVEHHKVWPNGATGKMNHVQVNPAHPNLVMYTHDGASPQVGKIFVRQWMVDFDKDPNEAYVLFDTELVYTDKTVQLYHEEWSANGQWMVGTGESILGKGIFMIDYEGRHRTWVPNALGYHFGHVWGDRDGSYAVADGMFFTLVNTITGESVAISRWKQEDATKSLQSWHGHPIIARNHHKVTWGNDYRGVLGVYWIDYTDIVENEFARGGRYPVNETVDRISYEGLNSEITEVTKGGEKCFYIKNFNSLYLDVNPDISDSINGSVKVEFDYFDNSTRPLVFTYSLGSQHVSESPVIDKKWFDNATHTIQRTATNSWKHAEIYIENGNFESPAPYRSDMNISGLNTPAFVKNVVVTSLDK